MKPSIGKSLISISSAIVISAGLVACSGERETASYPVAKLNPERISPRHLLHKTNHQKAEVAPTTDQSPNTDQQDIVKLKVSDAGSQLSAETGRTIFPDKYYRSYATNEFRNDKSLLASASNEPDLCYLNSGQPIIATGDITRDDTISDNGERIDRKIHDKQSRDNNYMTGFGIASLVTGIIGLVFPYFAPVAIVFGAIGLNKRLRGLAIAGMVLGIFTTVIYIVAILLLLIALSGPGI